MFTGTQHPTTSIFIDAAQAASNLDNQNSWSEIATLMDMSDLNAGPHVLSVTLDSNYGLQTSQVYRVRGVVHKNGADKVFYWPADDQGLGVQTTSALDTSGLQSKA